MEDWVDIKGYEGRYRVNRAGEIISRLGRRIKLRLAQNGYLRVWLYKMITYKPFTVHRIVAESFISNPENKKWVNHKNGIKTDNRSENLEWCTQRENMIHAFRTGLQGPNNGEKNGRSKLTEDQVMKIRSTHHFYNSHEEIAIQYGVTRRTIDRIINYSNWKIKNK